MVFHTFEALFQNSFRRSETKYTIRKIANIAEIAVLQG